MRILGLSSFRHDTSAALLEDNRIVAAIEDAKLARTTTRGLPESAIRYCLESAGVTWHDLDEVAVSARPVQGWMRRSWRALRTSPAAPVSSAYFEANELGSLARDLSTLRVLRHKNGCKFRNYEHHECHAASAFYLSPFEKALILTMDEDGDGRCGTLSVGEGTAIRPLLSIAFPHSVAWVYSQITELLGFSPHKDEHKTQWLSLEGEGKQKDLFLRIMRSGDSRLPRLDSSFLNYGVAGRLGFSTRFYKHAGIPEGAQTMSEDQRRDLASSVQQAATEIVGDLLEFYCKKEGIQNVCLGGGLFQNVLMVSDLERRLGLERVFVPPAPGNSGCSVGAALLAWHQKKDRPRREFEAGSYWGPAFPHSQIKDVLDNSKSRYQVLTTSDRRYESTTKLLQAGKIVGWFQGRAEFGPRALGNRSLLASLWAPYVKENMNDFVKHREWFRPFAISVPEEDCAKYFEASRNCGPMNSLAMVKPGVDVVPEDFLLPGRRVRLHVVDRKSNPGYWNLLKRFGEQAPAPMLLNTSFNIAGEPLVTRPQDAVRSYYCSGIDALVLESFVLSKATAAHVLAGARVGQVVVST